MHVVNLYLHVTRILTNVHVIFSGMYTNSYVLNKNHFANSKKVSYFINIKPYVNQPEFEAFDVNLSRANKCSVDQANTFISSICDNYACVERCAA